VTAAPFRARPPRHRTEHAFIAVSRRHIVFAIPLGEADAALAA